MQLLWNLLTIVNSSLDTSLYLGVYSTKSLSDDFTKGFLIAINIVVFKTQASYELV